MSAPQQPQDPNRAYVPEGYELAKKKKPWYKRLGCIVPIAIIALLIIVVAVNSGGDDSSSTTTATTSSAPAPQDGQPVTEEEAVVEDVPAEFRSALKKAESYIRTMPMSKDGLYTQLTSDFDQFSPEAAQYAVDTVEADWNELALKKAQSYQDTMSMSPGAIYDQLISSFEQFTPEQAQYAIDNL